MTFKYIVVISVPLCVFVVKNLHYAIFIGIDNIGIDNKVSNEQTQSINPATGEIIGHFPIHSPDDLKHVIGKARIAQKTWQITPLKKRIKHIKNIASFIFENSDRMSRIISEDNGKAMMDAFATEVFPSIMAINYDCKMAAKWLKSKKLKRSNIFFIYKRCKIRRVPWGVVGIISPWNYPFSIPFYQVIMGLLSGNAVILKTASETQAVGKLLQECLDSADLPENLFTHINMPGRLIGDALFDCGIDKLFFTGSLTVGKKLMAKAAESLTPISLELGGNDAMIICQDADLDRAVGGALWAGFHNCGQSCGGIERIYVHEAVYHDFLQILKSKIESLRLGVGTNWDIDMGAMTTSGQVYTVKQHIEEALSKGATLAATSTLPSDQNIKNFIPAVVLSDVDHSMSVMKEESFGPVVGVMKYKTIEEAITLANDSTMGLTGSVWSSDRKKAEQIGKQIEAGVISINDHLMTHGMPETPWGGFKESGMGRCHGEIGFEEMTQPQLIAQDLLPWIKRYPWWHPYSENSYIGIHGILHFLYAKNIFAKLNGLMKFIKIVPGLFLTKNQIFKK
jgi:succinate-semialdehyde dehydrogenase/glutarate-semialdehyde dehydrogenase